MPIFHDYTAQVICRENRGQVTKTYGGYARSWDLCSPGKLLISCLIDPVFVDGSEIYNLEDLLVSALSVCHMLSYLHLISEASVYVQPYHDHLISQREALTNSVSRFLAATFQQQIMLSNDYDPNRAELLHYHVSDW